MEINQDVFASESPWISINCPDMNDILKHGEKKLAQTGTVLVDIGEMVNNFYYLHNGQVKLSAMTKDGLEKTIWYINSPGIFGETPFFHNQPCKWIISASKDCEYYVFTRKFIMENLANYPNIMKYVFQLLASKIRVLSSQIENLAFREPVVRVAHLLYVMVCQSGKKIKDNVYSADIRLTHQEIADITGLHRVTASNALKSLYENGIITKKRSKIIVSDIKRLKKIIDDT